MPYILYSLLFWGMWSTHSPVPTDSLEGIVKEPIQIEGINNNLSNSKKLEVLSRANPPVLIIKKESYYFPILMQDKHSGLVIGFYKVLNDLIGLPDLLFKYWHFFAGLIQIFLFSSLLSKRLGDSKLQELSTIVFALHPLTVFDYGFFITESYTLIIFLLILNMTHSPKKATALKIGALLALGFWSRVNFIWLACSALCDFIKLSRKKIVKIFFTGLILTVPYLALIDYARLSEQIGGVYGERVKPLQNLFHFFTLFFSTEESMSFLWSNQFYRDIEIFQGIHFISDPVFIISLILVLLWSILEKGKSLLEFRKDALGLALFLVAMTVSLGGLSTYANYIYPIRIWSTIFFSLILFNMFKGGIKGRVFCLSLFSCLSFNAFSTYKSYYSNGPVLWHNMSITSEVLTHMKDRKNLFVLGEGDIGKFEYLSNNTIRPKHLYLEVSKGKYKTFLDLLEKNSEGSIAVPMIDEWSGWYWSWGGVNPKDVIDQSRFYGVEISNQAWVIRNNKKMYWIFDFKKSERD